MPIQNPTITALLALLMVLSLGCAADEDSLGLQDYWVGRWKVNAI